MNFHLKKLMMSALAITAMGLTASAQTLQVESIKKVPVPKGTIVYTATVSPDGSYVIYSDATKAGLSKLDLATGKNYRATDVKGTWESPAWGPDNRQVVCKRSDGARASLFIVDTWTGGARQLLATKNHLSMPAWSGVQVRK